MSGEKAEKGSPSAASNIEGRVKHAGLRAMLVAILLSYYILPATATDPKNPNHEPAAIVRIIVKNGEIVDVAPVSGSPKVAAAAVEFVKKNWKFRRGQNGVFTLPVVIKHAK